ncbi:YALI0D03888p [Yarrowia lipolytica CLIB122]|uniref:Serine/threonine-protein kinase TEL1 n=1 Tax=Yarrowia lipolytica (strain CLIB 122 / E 150) TaxID=284591 RepID=ATM_YARLI|nr:YALI0D03888p [Yarrowia lipolytica CLIB122]Q6CAD2.1 RecName: Full=Serine/threonine-protein kinase TEL1; AltName: Full=ATM homolog; AltName: Full=DNA-damage checkpoint kinase TEL1; AltName: Full=Telomere length regulation protein 1 [Yarrowia lipolytica CLIB122]KAB8284684.1 Serine/threonine-protein kinase TEL1 [Yarrowia lipolytica]KAE8171309.1 Serine/threonine-protein kinase TEL1 [Yarrowia lipolytica]KAJ8054827.1 Serine/threonine-protein kinase TEL1 [Yarrowia lipolytica]RMI96694.1 Serine/threo|eukprot:XP_502380.1 YALI0D03888p [Yarrowia lipolytica CLIB122]
MVIRGVCDSISRDIASSAVTGKRHTTQMSIFKTIARGHGRFKARSSRQFIVSTVCELLLARHKDRGSQLIVASNLRLVLSHKPHLEHLLWDHYRRSVACLCRELSALCVNSMEESGLEMLIQELLLCLDLLTKPKYVGMAELKHDLWNCIDSMLYKYKEVSEMHVLILSISVSLFQVVFGSDYEICHEMVPSIFAIGTKLFTSKSKAVREISLRFLLKMEIYLASIFGKTCPVPLDQDRLNQIEDHMVELLQVLKNEYNSSSLQDNDVVFEDEIVLVNSKKTMQFLICKLIAMLEYVLSYTLTDGNVKQEEDLHGPRKKPRVSISPETPTLNAISAQIQAFQASKPISEVDKPLASLLSSISGSLDKTTRWKFFSAAKLLAQSPPLSPKNAHDVVFLTKWWTEGVAKLRTRSEDSACVLLTTILRQHSSALDPKLVVSLASNAESKGPLKYSNVSLEFVTCASQFLISHKACSQSQWSDWLFVVLASEQIGATSSKMMLDTAGLLLASVGCLIRMIETPQNTLETTTSSIMWKTDFKTTSSTSGDIELTECMPSITIRDLKSGFQNYLNELGDWCESASIDVNVVLPSTVFALVVCAVLDRQGTPVGLNSRISDFLAVVTKRVEGGSCDSHVFFEAITLINRLRHYNLLGDSLCILWDSFINGIEKLLNVSQVTENEFDPDSPSGKNIMPDLRLSLLLRGPLKSEPFLLAIFPSDIKQYASCDPGKRLPELFRYVGQTLLSSYLWDCSPLAKQLVVDLLDVYFKSGMTESSDADDLQRWVSRDKFLVGPQLLYGLMQVSTPSEYLNLYSSVAICAAERVSSQDSYHCMDATLTRMSSAKSKSRLVVEEMIVALLSVHRECLSLLPVVIERVKTDMLRQKLDTDSESLVRFCKQTGTDSILDKILSVKVGSCVFEEEGHFSTQQLLCSEDSLQWNTQGPPLDILSRTWPDYSPCTLLMLVRGLLNLMLKPRVSFEVPLRLVQLKYVLCLFPKRDLCSPDNYVLQQMVSCLISFLSHSTVGASVRHLLSELFEVIKLPHLEGYIADLGEQSFFGADVSQLLYLLHPSEPHLCKYIEWVNSGFSDPEAFLSVFLHTEISDKLKATLLKSLDFGVTNMTLLGLMDIVCTKETVSFIKRASKLYSFDWEESRVLSLLLGRGYLLFGESSNSAPKTNTETSFWNALTSEFLTLLRGSDFTAKFAVEVCLSKIVTKVQVQVPAELQHVFDSGVLEYTHTDEPTTGWVQKTTLELLGLLGGDFELLIPLVRTLSSTSPLLPFIFKWTCLEYCRQGEPSYLSQILSQNSSLVVIETFFFVNSFTAHRTLNWQPEIVNSALTLHLYTEALYFLEADKACWASQEIQPSYYDIYQNIDDPDLFYGLKFTPCLESALKQLNHENQNLTCFEYESGLFDWSVETGGGESKTDILSHLSTSGMNGLAYTINSDDVYRWKLGLLEDPILETGTDDQTVLSQLRSIVVDEKPVLKSTLSDKYLGMQYLLYQMQLDANSDYLDRIQPPDGVLDILQFCASAWRTIKTETASYNGILTLSKLGAVSRELNNAQISKNCAVSLQELSRTASHISGNVCAISIASCLWSEAAVSRTTPVEMLKRMLGSINPGQSPVLASQFCQATVLLTDWSSQARMMSPEKIHRLYIAGASEYMALIPAGNPKTRMFHVFAKFCETQLHSQNYDEQIHNAVMDIERLEGELANLSRISMTREIKHAQRISRKSLDRAKESKLNYERLKAMFLDSAVQFYLLSCAVRDSEYHEDVTRLISLWFGNSHVNFVNERMQDYALIPSFKLAPLINQLSSKLSYEPNNYFQTLLLDLVSATCKAHPFHCLYQISSLMRTDASPQTERRIQAAVKVWNTVKTQEKTICRAMEIFTDKCVELANAEWPGKGQKASINQFPNGSWWQNGLRKLNIPPPTAQIPLSLDYTDIPSMNKVLAQVIKAGGISHPKIMDFQLSDGSVSKALLKGGKDDMRQDAIMEQVFCRVNQYFLGDPETRKRGLSIRTYNVVPMGPRAGMIEFVANTESLQAALVPLHEKDDWDYLTGRTKMSAVAKESNSRRVEVLEEIYTHVTPVMSQYFFQNFRSSAQAWFKARTNYVRSAAASSMLGYILGIGDRHCNNIMIDYKTGQLVHIDLGISFDQGKNLTVPEKVPFRLTRDMVDAMGSVGVDGPFRRCCELSLGLFREQQDNILSILNVLRYDPLYSWTMSPKKKQTRSSSGSDLSDIKLEESNVTADMCLSGVKGKLAVRLSTEAVVRELIGEAVSVENLAVIFHGWTPFY